MKIFLKVEYLLLFMLGLLFIEKSFLLESFFSSNNVNIFLLGATLIMLLVYKFNTSRLAVSFIVVLPVLVSFVANNNAVEIGGYNTVFLYIASLLFFSLNIEGVDLQRFYRGILLLAFVYLFVNFYFYFSGKQQGIEYNYYVFSGAYVNQNIFSMGLVSLLSLIVFLGSSTKVKTGFSLHVVVFILLVSILLTQARAAMLSGSIITLYLYRKRIYLFFLIVGGVVIFILNSNQSFYNRLYSKFTESGSGHRVEFLLNALNNLFNSMHVFFFGEGSQQVRVVTGNFTLSIHNSYMNYVMSYGVPAFLALVFFIWYVLTLSLKKNITGFVMISSLFLYGIFETVLFGSFSAIWFTLLLIFIFTLQENLVGKHI